MTHILVPKCNIWTPPSKWQRPWVGDIFPWLQKGRIDLSVSAFPHGVSAAAGAGGDGPTVLLDALTVMSDTPSSGTASVQLEVERSGDYVVDLSTQTNEWVASGDKTSTLGDDYEVELSKTSGTLTSSGPAVDTWHTISTDRIWTWSSTAPFEVTWNGTIEVREIANTSNTDTSSISITLEVLGGGGILL